RLLERVHHRGVTEVHELEHLLADLLALRDLVDDPPEELTADRHVRERFGGVPRGILGGLRRAERGHEGVDPIGDGPQPRDQLRALALEVALDDRVVVLGGEGRALDLHVASLPPGPSFFATSRKNSSRWASRKKSWPNAFSIPSTWLTCASIAFSFSSRSSGGSSK